MQFGKFRLGLRTLKTALAVMLIITSFYFLIVRLLLRV